MGKAYYMSSLVSTPYLSSLSDSGSLSYSDFVKAMDHPIAHRLALSFTYKYVHDSGQEELWAYNSAKEKFVQMRSSKPANWEENGAVLVQLMAEPGTTATIEGTVGNALVRWSSADGNFYYKTDSSLWHVVKNYITHWLQEGKKFRMISKEEAEMLQNRVHSVDVQSELLDDKELWVVTKDGVKRPTPLNKHYSLGYIDSLIKEGCKFYKVTDSKGK